MSHQIEVQISPADWAEEPIFPTCNVLLLYEDLLLGKQAMELLRQLNKRVGDQVALRFRMWRFDVLALSLTRAAAAANAANADVIVFAARSGLELKPEVKHWIEHEWQPWGDGQDRAFVVLLDNRNGVPSARVELLLEFLRATAARLGTSFIMQVGGPTPDDHLGLQPPRTCFSLEEAPRPGLQPTRQQ